MTSKAILEWEDKVLSKYYLKYGITSLTEEERQNIFDWLTSHDGERYYSRLIRLTVPAVIKLSAQWVKNIRKNVIKETEFDITPVLACPKGYQWVKLNSAEAYLREGMLMRHCVNHYASKPYSVVYSLRDKNNEPHCTIEVEDGLLEPALNLPVYRINQISGKMNRPVPKKYRSYLIEMIKFLQSKGYSIEPSVYTSNNLIIKDNSYIDVSSLSKVDGDLDLSFFKGEMPSTLEVSGNLILSYANPKKLTTKLKVGGKVLVTTGFTIPQGWTENEISIFDATLDCIKSGYFNSDFR